MQREHEHMSQDPDDWRGSERETVDQMPVVDQNTIARLNQSEIEQQVATARRYPRSIKRFVGEIRDMALLDQATAIECMYSLPRGGKAITGPSARFAEIVSMGWTNCHSGARVVGVDDSFITAQGVFYDCERNVRVTIEVQRRITDSRGNRFKDDMIGVTGNAAISIALRNAVLKGVPKAYWAPIFEEVRSAIRGDIKTLGERRGIALEFLQKKYSVSADRVCGVLGVAGIEDIGLDELLTLHGMVQALKDGDSTVDDMFPEAKRPGAASLNAKLRAAQAADVQTTTTTVDAATGEALREDLQAAAVAMMTCDVCGQVHELGTACPKPSEVASKSAKAGKA
jgi:hypothetical protein